ncbi:MAG: hypothetical protein LWW85_11145 [Marinilabiliales bacterium]|nr:hypothetical protein [Marinilabiliales bacterium]
MKSIGYFEIQSAEPSRAIAFYHALFEWEFTRQEGIPIEYYHIETGSITGGLMKRPADLPDFGQTTNAFTCSVSVDNFDEMSERILASGGQLLLPKFAIYGKCWQGYFLDPDQNCFGLFQVDPLAGI